MIDRPGSAPTPSPGPVSPTLIPGPAGGVCGPDVTAEFQAVLAKIQQDFKTWSKPDREKACTRILIPVQKPTWKPGTNAKDFMRSAADINGWDILPLYQGASDWLRDPLVVAAGCAIPTSTGDANDPFDDLHENPGKCSNTVQIGNQCWLNGTANYGAYGIMVRLCSDEFPIKFALALQMAKTLIRAYKKLGAHPEDAADPISWVEATYRGGPTATPSRPGNRPNCACGCSLKGGIVNWDYVWEPAKPRTSAAGPALTMSLPVP